MLRCSTLTPFHGPGDVPLPELRIGGTDNLREGSRPRPTQLGERPNVTQPRLERDRGNSIPCRRSGNSDLVVLYFSSDCVNDHAAVFNVEPFIEGCQVPRFRPQLRISIPSGQLRFEEGLVVRLDPSSDGSLSICILRRHQIHGAVLFEVLTGDPWVILVWVCFVDPADCRVLVLEQDGSSIDRKGGVAVGAERGGESKANAVLQTTAGG